jgi:TPR repeat protein
LAVAQGNVGAQQKLGVMYESGQGETQDYEEAVRLYKLAAEQGSAIVQTRLGLKETKHE